MSDYIVAWRIHRDSMGGSSFLPVVYTDHDVANAKAKTLDEEFTAYKAVEVKVRVLNQQEGAVASDLVQIDRTTWSDWCRTTGLAKLNADERAALIPSKTKHELNNIRDWLVTPTRKQEPIGNELERTIYVNTSLEEPRLSFYFMDMSAMCITLKSDGTWEYTVGQ